MRIFLLINNDNLYQPYIYERIIVARREEIVGIGLVPFLPPKRGKRHFYRFFLRLYGVRGTIIKSTQLFYYKALSIFEPFFSFSRSYSIRNLARRYAIPLWHIQNINDQESVRLLRSLQPDIIISGQGQLIEKEVLDIPRIGIINKHAGMLPNYRGTYPIFWAMLNNEQEVGITVHFMNEKFDDGEIIVQRRIIVEGGDTFESLYKKVIEVTPEIMFEALDRIEKKEASGIENVSADATYYSYPQKGDILKFKRMGKRII